MSEVEQNEIRWVQIEILMWRLEYTSFKILQKNSSEKQWIILFQIRIQRKKMYIDWKSAKGKEVIQKLVMTMEKKPIYLLWKTASVYNSYGRE